jgi:TM2 domain-containing membrane protein YozV
MKNKKTLGIILLVVGIILLLLSALNFILGYKFGLPPLVFGILFTSIGRLTINKSKIQD